MKIKKTYQKHIYSHSELVSESHNCKISLNRSRNKFGMTIEAFDKSLNKT